MGKGAGRQYGSAAIDLRQQAAAPEEVLAGAVAEQEEEVLRINGRRRGLESLTHAELASIKTRDGLVALLRQRKVNLKKVVDVLRYEEELALLQIELVKFQRWVQDTDARVAVLFEGRDAAGKGGTIRRFTEHLNPRSARVVALPKPTDEEQGQWYFQRYARQLPNPGEIVFFDRSWYNRAVVEPVNGFCNETQYETFVRQVPEFEHMLYEDGVHLIKFWFSISKTEQKKRFESRRKNPLKQWKLSPVDGRAQDLWDSYTRYKEEMFSRTHTSFSPWIIVRANNKRRARLGAIRGYPSRDSGISIPEGMGISIPGNGDIHPGMGISIPEGMQGHARQRSEFRADTRRLGGLHGEDVSQRDRFGTRFSRMVGAEPAPKDGHGPPPALSDCCQCVSRWGRGRS